MNVKMRLDGRHLFSISQEGAPRHLVEVALFCDAHFVPCNVWATNWVGEDYDDDVIRMLNAHDVSDLLQFAKEYVYIKDHENAKIFC
jgi:hypothetical protein